MHQHGSLFCENFSSLTIACSGMLYMPGYDMPLILTLFENESQHRYFTEVWNIFQEQVFLSIATSKTVNESTRSSH